MKVAFRKTQSGLVPADQECSDWFGKVKPGGVVTAEFKKKQNSLFHSKLFALLNLGFENWQPSVVQVRIAGEPVVPEKNFTRFRNDLTILAGYYRVVERLDGTTRVEALSLSYDKMEPEDREDIYSKFIDVLLANIYTGLDRKDIDKMVQQYLEFS